MGTQIALVYVDEWQGLYVNERLVMEDHRIDAPQLMQNVLHQSVDRFDYIEASDAHMAMTGSFPRDLGDVVLPDGHTLYEQWEKE